MDLIIQVIVTGLSVGAVYALFALCIATLYRLTGVVHLAIGELAGLAVFAVILIAQGASSPPAVVSPPRIVVAVAAALFVTGLAGAVVFKAAIDPFLRRGFSVAWVGGVVAAAVVLHGVVRLVFPAPSYRMPELLPTSNLGRDGIVSLGDGVTIQLGAVVAGIVGMALVLLLIRLVGRSRAGLRLRAVSEDRLAAALCGVRITTVQLAAFVIASMAVGILGMMATSGQSVSAASGSLLGLKGLIGAVAAGFGTPRRVIFVSLGLGVLETTLSSIDVAGFELGPGFANVIPVALAILLVTFWGHRGRVQEQP